MRIGILNSGGDCPGLNAVIHGVVGAAHELGWETIGFKDGFEGLLPPGDFRILQPKDALDVVQVLEHLDNVARGPRAPRRERVHLDDQ